MFLFLFCKTMTYGSFASKVMSTNEKYVKLVDEKGL
jgi:hypothetical protein